MLTFTQAAAQRGIALPGKTTRASINSLVAKMRRSREYYNRIPSDTDIRRLRNCHHRLDREFPEQGAYNHRAIIEMQSPLVTITRHDEGDCHLPEYSYSSKGLTDWYVAEFCRINHLK